MVHCFICSHPFFATSWTGLVEDTGTSVSVAEDVDSVVSLVCDVVLLAVSDAVTSSGYRQAIGQFVLPVVVEISADQINLSASLLTPSIIASFHFILSV